MEGKNKRPRDESNPDYELDQPDRRAKRPPKFIDVIRGAMIAEMMRSLCSSIEPIIRKAVQEEVQKCLPSPLRLHGNRLYIIENPQPIIWPLDSKLKLIFANQVSQQIYTGNQITDDSKNPLQVQLVDTETGIICENCEGSSAKVQIVVIDGDLEEEGCDSNKFNDKIVRPRDGKAALLSGKTIITLKQGVANLEGVSFTDNSRCIRSGKFRLGVCVDSGTSTSTDTSNGIIKEGLSEKFAVKDHRGELNKKHYPPILCLQDETWRLENIARDGKYHIRLKENGINNVQDLLRKWFANSNELQNTILRMSKNAWNKLINHAKKCPMADDSYLFRSEGTVIRFNPIGEILEAFIGGTSYPYNVLAPQLKDFVLQLASQAYKQWDKLEKVSIHSPLNQSNSNLPYERKNTGYGNAVDLERDTFGAHSSNFMNFNIDGFMDSDINSFENLYGSYSDF